MNKEKINHLYLQYVESLRYIKKIAMIILLYPLRIIPLKRNLVLMDNSLSHTYSDSPKAVISELKSSDEGNIDITLSVFDVEKYANKNKKGINTVKYGSFMYYCKAMSCSVYLTNSGGYSYLPLRKKQIVINTWHGGGCYKKMGKDKKNVSKGFEKELKLAAKKTNYFLSSCKMFSDAIERALLIDKSKQLMVGLPRNDMLVNYSSHQSQEIREKTRESLGIKDNQKLVLYSPTYRKKLGEPFGKSIAAEYAIDVDRICSALSKRFGGEWIFGYRLHPNIRNEIQIIPDGTLDLTGYEDMQELILAADVMINDFSSCMWDFMLTNKPCFTYAADMKEYIEDTQVYSPVCDWPFPKAENNDELIHNILYFDYDQYHSECDRHYKELGGCETGKASKIVAQIIKQQCVGALNHNGESR